MNDQNSHIDDLLVKHMLGEASREEETIVQQWLDEGEANRQHYAQIQEVWDSSKVLASKSNVNEEEAWTRFQQRVTDEETIETKRIPLIKRLGITRVAAAVLVLICCGWLINSFVLNGTTTLMADNEVITETLPDGSVVTINKGSSITFNKRLSGDTREVTLEGEAFFDVARNPDRPFIITAGEAQVKVLGTSFNVKSSKEETEVIVETGLVAVSKEEEMVELHPKEKATVLKSNPIPVKTDVQDGLYSYYRTKELVCNNTPLWRLAEVLNEAYNVDIEITDPKLKTIPITTTFKNQSLDDILLVIAESLSVRIDKQGRKVIIR